MFASHSSEQGVIASQLRAGLLAYDQQLKQLLTQRWDPELYRALSDQFDQMQMYAAALPSLAVSWSELLITRIELVHALWTLSTPSRVNGKVVALHAQHCVLIKEVLRKCREYGAAASQ